MIYSIKQDTLWYIDYQRSDYLLAERVYSRRTLEVKVRSVHENIHIMQSTSRISPFSEINTKHPSFSRETLLQKSELNTKYWRRGCYLYGFLHDNDRDRDKEKIKNSLLSPEKHENQTCNETFIREIKDTCICPLNI